MYPFVVYDSNMIQKVIVILLIYDFQVLAAVPAMLIPKPIEF